MCTPNVMHFVIDFELIEFVVTSAKVRTVLNFSYCTSHLKRQATRHTAVSLAEVNTILQAITVYYNIIEDWLGYLVHTCTYNTNDCV